MQVALNFVKDILAGTSEEDRASLGILALSHEGEVIVADFLDLEESAHSADVALLKLLGTVDDGGASATSNSVVVSLTKTTEDSDVTHLEQVVLGSVRDTFLGDDNIGVELEDGLTHAFDLNLLHSERLLEISSIGELHGGHGLSLLVLKGAIEEDNTGVADHAAHIGVGDVLVEHDTVENDAVLEHTAGNLLDLGVPLGVDLNVLTVLLVDSADGLDGEVDDKVAPLGSELSANAALDNLGKVSIIRHVNGVGHRLGHLAKVIKSLEVGADDDGGVDITLQEALNGGKDLTSQDDDGCGAITDLLVLGASKFNHGLSSGMCNIDLQKNITCALISHFFQNFQDL